MATECGVGPVYSRVRRGRVNIFNDRYDFARRSSVWEKFTNVWEIFTNVWENFTNVWENFTNVWEIFTNVWEIFTNVWEISINVWEVLTNAWEIFTNVFARRNLLGYPIVYSIELPCIVIENISYEKWIMIIEQKKTN